MTTTIKATKVFKKAVLNHKLSTTFMVEYETSNPYLHIAKFVDFYANGLKTVTIAHFVKNDSNNALVPGSFTDMVAHKIVFYGYVR